MTEVYTLQDDEGCFYTRAAMEAALRGAEIFCVASDRSDDDPPYLAVMISVERYNDLLETEWMYEDLSK